MESHYLAAFIPTPVFRGRLPRLQQSVCGAWIEATQHSVEPSCHACREWQLQEAEEDAETFAELGYVQNERGIWAPKES